MFYVYIHAKPDGTPFYVGKGSGNRARDFHNGRNRHHKAVVAKHGRDNIGVLIFDCDTEEAAHATEVEYIRQFREAGVQLANVCDGGEGASGSTRSVETRAKMAAYHLNRPEQHRQKISKSLTGKRHSEATKEKLSNLAKGRAFNPMLGRKHTPESLAKMSAAKVGRARGRDAIGRFAAP